MANKEMHYGQGGNRACAEQKRRCGQHRLSLIFQPASRSTAYTEKQIHCGQHGSAVPTIHPDRIGSVLFITDEKGMVIENNGIDEFGNKAEGISKHGLTSNMYDKDTGLYYFHARWYDADER